MGVSAKKKAAMKALNAKNALRKAGVGGGGSPVATKRQVTPPQSPARKVSKKKVNNKAKPAATTVGPGTCCIGKGCTRGAVNPKRAGCPGRPGRWCPRPRPAALASGCPV